MFLSKICPEDTVKQKDGLNNETIKYTTMINQLMTNCICEYKPLVILYNVCYFSTI